MSITTTARITCGNCKHTHESVAAVKACYQVKVDHLAAPASKNVPGHRQGTFHALASEKQRQFITKLDQDRTVPVAGKTAEEARNINTVECVLEGKSVTMQEASAAISWLLELPRTGTTVETAKVVFADVPAGRYAVTVDGVIKFFRVDRPTEGKWAGRTFLKIQASDELYPVRDLATKRQVLDLIGQDPKAASIRYGHELGQCGICGRTLTDETSRANGIGPICADKAGW